MQVFAGISESQANAITALAQPADSATQCSFADDGGLTADENSAADEIEMHVDLSDETVPAFPFLFATTAIAATAALNNDKARQPPFLPLPGPPPKA